MHRKLTLIRKNHFKLCNYGTEATEKKVLMKQICYIQLLDLTENIILSQALIITNALRLQIEA